MLTLRNLQTIKLMLLHDGLKQAVAVEHFSQGTYKFILQIYHQMWIDGIL